jgi:Folate-sensitive fragile site protein Fra10Ac1
MAAYEAHLRKIHNNEVIYNGPPPKPRPFTTERDIIDSQHKFLRSDSSSEDPLVQSYYESLIKDCVLVDLSRYKEHKVPPSPPTPERAEVGGYAVEGIGGG